MEFCKVFRRGIVLNSPTLQNRMRLLTMFALLLLTWLPGLGAQPTQAARDLDALLQDYAYRAFVRRRPKTGLPYNGVVPSNLTGIRIAALRLRSGSLRRKGAKYHEFGIPTGVIVQPYVKRLVLVYQNLGNWSITYYPLPNYTYLAPVLGLLAYNASNLSATNLRELDTRASGNSINISFPDVKSAPSGTIAKCVSFDLDGLISFSNVSGNVCSTVQQGHFSIVVQSAAPPPSGGPTNVSPIPVEREKKHKSRVWIIVGSVLGGLLLLVLLLFLVVWAQKFKQRKKMQRMEKAAEVGESLQMTSVGETKAPAAMVTRTQPTIESEYVP